MNKRIYLIGLIVILAGTALVWNISENIPTMVRAEGGPHSCDNHAPEKKVAQHTQAEIDAFFKEETHEDHEHASPAQKGRYDHESCGGETHDERAPRQVENDHGRSSNEICPEHRIPEAIDALCRGDHIAELQPGDGMQVRLASPDVAAKAGLALVKPRPVSLAGGIAIPGRVEFDRKHLAHITPLAAGIIRQVLVLPGSTVSKDDALAEIAMPEIASLKAQYLVARARQVQAKAAYEREKSLLARGISSRQEFQQAEAEYQVTQSSTEQYLQQLMNYGLSGESIRSLSGSGDTSAVVTLRAPFTGTVVEVKTAVGEAASPGAPLFTVANLDSLWVELSVPESRTYQLQVDAPVQVRFDGLPGMIFAGRIFQVSAVVDERTRTLKALAEVKNPGHRLKVGMFGSTRLVEKTEAKVLAVPAGALQAIDNLHYVFVSQGPDLFELRRVKSGVKENGIVTILAGLSPNDQVVASQGFALKSEVLKARLGASCADH
jgi:membrane fusion protein, heavy metal efflux system